MMGRRLSRTLKRKRGVALIMVLVAVALMVIGHDLGSAESGGSS